MSDVRPWAKVAGRAEHAAPRTIKRPCDYGLELAVSNLEIQLGTIEAYNRLAVAATALKAKIDNGEARPQNPIYAVRPRG